MNVDENDQLIVIHYWLPTPKQHMPFRTGCGKLVRELPDDARLSSSLDIVDCEACLISDECQAQRMEESLTTPSTVASFRAFTDELTEKIVKLCLSTSSLA
jgi:hypothetical protein